MLKRPLFLFCVCTGVIVIVLFRVKYEVSALELQRQRLEKDIILTQESIHMLKAEWHHLNDPKRIQKLCAKYLPDLRPVEMTQLINLQDMMNAPGDDQLSVFLNELLDSDLKDNRDSLDANEETTSSKTQRIGAIPPTVSLSQPSFSAKGYV